MAEWEGYARETRGLPAPGAEGVLPPTLLLYVGGWRRRYAPVDNRPPT